MLKQVRIAVAAVAFLGVAGHAVAADMPAYVPTVSHTLVPAGWFDFCQREPQECKVTSLPPVNISSDNVSALVKLNISVNKAIKPVTNWDHWHTTADHWDYAKDGKGDCKIFAIQKRKQLMDAGFPRQALLLATVYIRTKDGYEGHTILVVRTDKGDFVLDNLTDAIVPWYKTGYLFHSIQSPENPNVWLKPAEVNK